MSAAEWSAAVKEMRRLFDHDPTDKKSLKEWVDASIALCLRLRTVPESSDVEEIVWHFLFDADIRVKAPEYAQAQREAFESWLQDAERALLSEP
ncbi:hypothetical protein FJV41_46355 [Myxococcus llanfairpwllgwyngyllgogerychwyrndrobwllllantysiliogogogochensis]|uniref:Uncharacterized protein n=1 Tax=Myxococcus llanfairpwllgwyngyllgogerychwyrndrobwllllantysiliogogogochensis TaxID=2590453 RepID=A0A540WKZ6_9BACT|nr:MULTISPECIES: hypothetical protein [Myxococcus]NTX34029.1 hypothetical protein [Myxococcus sp. CA033]TQF09114.1 hypothetical protein FJV41_46355 [Myxococcus llanfairpwllgwyngyllgogerychwyrndrobwllllantysiliogogogochensis]